MRIRQYNIMKAPGRFQCYLCFFVYRPPMESHRQSVNKIHKSVKQEEF